MRHIDEDTITQAVIARHAAAADVRLREVMTSLVQHLHAFAREAQLSEAEWAAGLRFVGECARATDGRRPELELLSDTLGLTMLVTALNQRKPKACTEPAALGPFRAEGAPRCTHGDDLARGTPGEPCYVRGVVRAPDGSPIAGAEVQVWQAGANGRHDAPPLLARGVFTSGADGGFHFKTVVAAPYAIAHDGPVGRMLQALGRHAWRPAQMHFMITAPGYERLVTQVLRQGDPYIDSDAGFGVRGSLVADWVRHDSGRTPDGRASEQAFTTLDFALILNATTGDTP